MQHQRIGKKRIWLMEWHEPGVPNTWVVLAGGRELGEFSSKSQARQCKRLARRRLEGR